MLRYLRKIFTRLLLWSSISAILLSMVLVLPLIWLNPPTTSFMLQAGAADGATRYQWVDYRNISPYVALAVIAAEDQRFPEHYGIDFKAIRQALDEHAQGRALRGASTITQQLAKNLYLWPARSLPRKALEAWFTLWLETFWSKQRILEIYLNTVQLDTHIFGVEAASRRYFRKSARELNTEEAALLAAVLPSPKRYRIVPPSAYMNKRQRWIMQQMRQLGGLRYIEKLEKK